MQNEMQFSDGAYINDFGEIIRPNNKEIEQESNFSINNNEFSLTQRIAQLLQKSKLLMNIPFVEKFVEKQLNVLPPATEYKDPINESRKSFDDWITRNGELRNLPPIQRMSDPQRIEQMQKKMEKNGKEDNGLSL